MSDSSSQLRTSSSQDDREKNESATTAQLVLREDLIERLARWAARHPAIRASRIAPLSATIVAAAPFCRPEQLEGIGRSSLWFFAADDMFDESFTPSSELEARIHTYSRITKGETLADVSANDPLVLPLRDTFDALSNLTLFEPLCATWSEAVIQNLNAMLLERLWTERETVPTRMEYMKNGSLSIGGIQHFLASFMAVDDSSIKTSMVALQPLIRAACICLRLANDIRSYEREKHEGTANLIKILMRSAYGLPELEARSMVETDLRTALQLFEQCGQTMHTATGVAERIVIDTTKFACNFYSFSDYDQGSSSAS